jgi:hypothetical protein
MEYADLLGYIASNGAAHYEQGMEYEFKYKHIIYP